MCLMRSYYPALLASDHPISNDSRSNPPRLSDRWTHLPSGRVYNLSYNRPRVEGRDDITGEALVKRPDDNPVRAHSFEIIYFPN